MKHLKTKRDKSHLTIMHELRARGYSVVDLASVGSGLPDLLVSYGDTVLIEIKEPDGSIYIGQLEFISTWKGYAGFARNVDEAAKLLRRPLDFTLSERDKVKIAQIAHRYRSKSKDKNPRISVKLFDKLMAEV